ncbi:hypothetical protein [Hoeflea sp. TYP-13]|uniref:hypothetical protein n=1 Tax=Hoeflea sp. TYP-13 TaxID=3230023 RepID=UPI0034C5C806
MHRPIAFCKIHGFFPNGIVIKGAVDADFSANRVRCPQCGGMCEIIPGNYISDGEHLSVLVDPSISIEALEELRKLAERLSRSDIDIGQAKAEAEKISRGSGRLFDIKNWSDEAQAMIAVAVIGAIAAVAAAKFSSKSDAPVVNITNQITIESSENQSKNSTSKSTVPIPKPKPKEPPKGSR